MASLALQFLQHFVRFCVGLWPFALDFAVPPLGLSSCFVNLFRICPFKKKNISRRLELQTHRRLFDFGTGNFSLTKHLKIGHRCVVDACYCEPMLAALTKNDRGSM